MLRAKNCSFKGFEPLDSVEAVGNARHNENDGEYEKEEKEKVYEEGFPDCFSPPVAKDFFEVPGEEEEE